MTSIQAVDSTKLRTKYISWFVFLILVVPVILDFVFYGSQIARYARVLIFGAVSVTLLMNSKLFMKGRIESASVIFGVGALYAVGSVADLSFGGVVTPNIALLLLFMFMVSLNFDLHTQVLRTLAFSFHVLTAISALVIVLRINPRGYFASSVGYPVFFDFIGIPGRNYGLLPHPNSLGQVAAVSLIFIITSKANKLLCLFPIICIIKCGSRTALIGIAVATLLYSLIWLFKRRDILGKRVALQAPLVTGTFILGILAASSAQFISFIGMLDPNALTARVSIWQSALGIFNSSPVFGLGWGWEGRAVEAQLINVWATSAHNALLDIAFSSGILGLTIFLLLISKVIVYFPFLSAQEKAVLCFLIASGISETFVDLQYPTVQTYAFFLIMIAANPKKAPEDE